MVNTLMNPMEMSPNKKTDYPTDINQNIDEEYYELLLKQHNYFPDRAFEQEKFEDNIKMEHSYTRDRQPTKNAEVMTTRTILIERPPLCPSCNQLPPNHDEKVDIPDPYNIPMPPYNEEAGRLTLDATQQAIEHCLNHNSDADDWVEKISKYGWSEQQLTFFERIERILDLDQLGRLAIKGAPNECLRRRALIEKSVSRMRQALASVHWEPRLTQWIHSLLVAHLPATYMVSYIDVLQTLKKKVPALVDKMLFGRPIDFHSDYMNAIMKSPWEPTMPSKKRTLPGQSVIIVLPSTASEEYASERQKRWCDLLGTLTTVVPIMVNLKCSISHRQSMEEVTEQLVAISRAKIQEIRNETPNRHIILVGFNAGAAIALQVALVEAIHSIICLGFAFNTLHGVRGAPDDRILELTTPVLFIVGQNAQKTSQEEIESLRERMWAQTSLVVVGSSDDSLRVKRLNRSMEGVSQSMIDNMIVDEIQEFSTTCILNPPGPRQPTNVNGYRHIINSARSSSPIAAIGPEAKKPRLITKTKPSKTTKRDRSSTQRSLSIAKNRIHSEPIDIDDKALQLALESILPADLFPELQNEIADMEPLLGATDNANISTYEVFTTKTDNSMQSPKPISNQLKTQNQMSPNITKQKVKIVPSNQFVHIKPPPLNTQKIYVKTPNAGNQSYTLGVTSTLSAGDGAIGKNKKLITVKDTNTAQLQQILTTSSYDISNYCENSSNLSSTQPTTAMHSNGNNFTVIKSMPAMTNGNDQFEGIQFLTDSNSMHTINQPPYDVDILNANLYDIPILFADNEVDFSEEIETQGEMAHSNVIELDPEAMQSLTVLSADDIVNDQPETQYQNAPSEVKFPNNLPSRKSTTSNSGNFVVLNRENLSQLQNVKHLSSIKFVPTVDSTTFRLNSQSSTNDLQQSSGTSMSSPLNGKTLVPGTKVNISNLVRSNQQLKSHFNHRKSADTAYKQQPKQDQTTINHAIQYQYIGDKPSTYINGNGKVSVSNTAQNRRIIIKKSDLSVIESGVLNKSITVRKVNMARSNDMNETPSTLSTSMGNGHSTLTTTTFSPSNGNSHLDATTMDADASIKALIKQLED